MKLLPSLALVATVIGAPTNDVTLYTRALFQDCVDENNDTLAVKFLEGNEKYVASHKQSRDLARNGLQTVSDHNVVYFSSRTNYIDSKILEWTSKDSSIQQVVFVAAGFDSRAYRMDLPQINFFEVDFPVVVAKKQAKVNANNLSCTGASVTYVGADLRNTTLVAALEAEAAYNTSAKTVFVVEGLIYYLHQDDVDTLFESIGIIGSSGDKTIFDFANSCIIAEDCPNLNKYLIKIFLTIVKAKGEPWFSGFKPGTVESWMEQWGFKVEELLSFQNAGEPPLSVKSWTNSTVFGQMNFITGEKI